MATQLEASRGPNELRFTSLGPPWHVKFANLKAHLAVSKNMGPHFGSPYNKDHNIFGSILGPPIYGSPHLEFADGRSWTVSSS